MNDQDIAGRFGASLERIELGDVSLRVAIAGDGPLVMLVHGFPESWYSWRHQIQPLVQAGFRVAAPDVRGYGGSDRPHPVEAYDIQSLTSDMFNLARFLSPDKPAVIVGHDWGGPIAWNSALIHPQQFRAVAGLSVPHVPPGDVVGIDVFRKVFTDNDLFFYMIYFRTKVLPKRNLRPTRYDRFDFFSALSPVMRKRAPGRLKSRMARNYTMVSWNRTCRARGSIMTICNTTPRSLRTLVFAAR